LIHRLRKWFAESTLRHSELNYGRGVITEWVADYLRATPSSGVRRVLDVGCGHGADLLNVKNAVDEHRVELFGLEHNEDTAAAARRLGIQVFARDVEKEEIPIGDAFFDIVIANQVIEHTKEIFWIFSEISRTLKKGGILIVGLPNLASLHNRLLLLMGEQPSAIDVLGPHVRGFTAPGFRRFITAGGYFEMVAMRGCNFYPFPPWMARPMGRAFPTMAVALLCLIMRTQKAGNFMDVLKSTGYETAYFTGPETFPPTSGAPRDPD
jgi:SAM-dependent methyltransferase